MTAAAGGESRPFVLFLHGLGQTPQAWQDQVVALPAGTGAVAPWLYGLRPGSAQRFDLEAAADDVVRTLDLQGIPAAHLIGAALGARVILEAARRHPDRVRSVVLAGLPGAAPRVARWASRLATRMVPKSVFTNQQLEKSLVVQATDAFAAIGPPSGVGVEQPTLIMVGANDSLGAPVARRLAEDMPQAKLQTIPGAAGMINTEAPTAFAEAMVDWLSVL